MKIKNIGGFLITDKNGFFVPVGSKDNIGGVRKKALDDIVQGYINAFGDSIIHSIRVRGSVAKGSAIVGISDIDTLCITHKEEIIEKGWGEMIQKEIIEKYASIEGVEWGCISKDSILLNERWVFTLRTQSVCIYGAGDTLFVGKRYQPNKQLVVSIIEQNLGARIAWVKNKFIQDPGQVRKRCTWIMKRILRGGCILVMVQSKKFSRDLYPCREIFSKYYPKQKENMYRALERAINPIDNREKLCEYLDTFGVWLHQEIEEIFL